MASSLLLLLRPKSPKQSETSQRRHIGRRPTPDRASESSHWRTHVCSVMGRGRARSVLTGASATHKTKRRLLCACLPATSIRPFCPPTCQFQKSRCTELNYVSEASLGRRHVIATKALDAIPPRSVANLSATSRLAEWKPKVLPRGIFISEDRPSGSGTGNSVFFTRHFDARLDRGNARLAAGHRRRGNKSASDARKRVAVARAERHSVGLIPVHL